MLVNIEQANVQELNSSIRNILELLLGGITGMCIILSMMPSRHGRHAFQIEEQLRYYMGCHQSEGFKDNNLQKERCI